MSDFTVKFTRLFAAVFLAATVMGCQPSANSQSFRAQDKQGQRNAQFALAKGQKNSGQSAKGSVNGVMKTAFSQVGKPYRHGGSSPTTGFDCSGFVQWVYGQYGVDLPRTSSSQASVGAKISRDQLQPGDLVFFSRKRGISHVGIYTGDNKYIHSPRTGKRIQESEIDQRGLYYVTARRVMGGAASIDESLKNAWVAEARKQLKSSGGPAVAAAGNQAGKAAKKVQTAKVETKADRAKAAKSDAKGKKPAAAKASSKQHTVKAGDTIYDLSRKYGVSSEELIKANKLAGKSKSNLKLGQTLVVPKKKN